MLSKYMGRHMAGNPKFIVQHMRGAGGTKAVNYVYTIAPKKRQYLVDPVSAKEVTAFVNKIMNTPPEMIWKLKLAMGLLKK